MLALRRASTNSLRAPGLNITAFRACAALGPFSSHKEDNLSASEPHFFRVDRWITSKTCNCTVAVPKLFSVGGRSLSSQAGAKRAEEKIDESEDGNSSSGSSLAASLEDALESELMGETREDVSRTAPAGLFKLILNESGPSIAGALDKYVESKELSRSKVYQVLPNLRKRKLFEKALQLSEWLEGRRKDYDVSDQDYAFRVDLIVKLYGLQSTKFKVRGIHKAESYIDTIPKSFKVEVVYRTLLANFVSASVVKNSERVFNKMKDLGFPISVFTCNLMLHLYMNNDESKIADILELMVNENLKPSLFTYKVLIDTKGQSEDIEEMEQIVDIMKDDGLEPDIHVQQILRKHYATAGLTDKEFVIRTEMIWCEFVNLCVAELGVEVADAFLQKKTKTYKTVRPMFVSFMTVFQEYSKRGDVYNARRIFRLMKQVGYAVGGKPFDALLQTYKNAKVPTSRVILRRRMEVDKLHPNEGPTAVSSLLDVFRETSDASDED